MIPRPGAKNSRNYRFGAVLFFAGKCNFAFFGSLPSSCSSGHTFSSNVGRCVCQMLEYSLRVLPSGGPPQYLLSQKDNTLGSMRGDFPRVGNRKTAGNRCFANVITNGQPVGSIRSCPLMRDETEASCACKNRGVCKNDDWGSEGNISIGELSHRPRFL